MLHFCIWVLQQSLWATLHYLSYSQRKNDWGNAVWQKEVKHRMKGRELRRTVHLVTFPWRWTRACITENVYENRDEVTHKNTHICFLRFYLIKLFSAFSSRLSNLLHKLLPLSSSSDLFLDLPGECGNLHHLSPLSTRNTGRDVSITDFYKNISNISHHLTNQEMLWVSHSSSQPDFKPDCYMWSSPCWCISATALLFSPKSLMMPRCLTSCCYGEENN